MVSLLAIEIYGVLLPVLACFFLTFIPGVSRAVTMMVNKLQALAPPSAPPLAILAIIFSVLFFSEFAHWQKSYSHRRRFPDIGQELQHEAKRLRVERNMYIHMCTSIACLALTRIARLAKERSSSRNAGAASATASDKKKD